MKEQSGGPKKQEIEQQQSTHRTKPPFQGARKPPGKDPHTLPSMKKKGEQKAPPEPHIQERNTHAQSSGMGPFPEQHGPQEKKKQGQPQRKRPAQPVDQRVAQMFSQLTGPGGGGMNHS